MTEPEAAPAPVSEAVADGGDALRLPRIRGQTLDKLPEDLYIPPDALEIFLEAFEGPLDLLLYLIRKQNLDILDIPVLKITEQYLKYIELMQEMRFELAAEYLLMAAWLCEIKSRMLLPRIPVEGEEEAGDPRAELARRLQEYERFKTAAETLDTLPRAPRDLFPIRVHAEAAPIERPLPVPGLHEILLAMRDVMARADLFTKHQITREPLSVRERMSSLLDRLRDQPRRLVDLVDPAEGKAGVVVCVLAILELAKLAMLRIVQAEPYAELQLALVPSEPEDAVEVPA